MSNKKEFKRKEQLTKKAKCESLRFQVKFGKNKLMPDFPSDDPVMNAELKVI